MFSFGSSALSLPPKTAKAVCRRLPRTPERIPTFIIPSPRARHRHHEDADRTNLLSPPDHCASPRRQGHLSPSLALYRRSPRFSKLSPASAGRVTRVADAQVPEDQSDLSTRAALSLEHVKKISTPYGFRTLAESPHVRRRESLFHGDQTRAAGHQPPTNPCIGVGTPLNKRRENSARLPSDSQQVGSPSEGHRETSAKSPNPNGVLKAAKDGLQMVLKKTRNALRTPTPRRTKGPSSTFYD